MNKHTSAIFQFPVTVTVNDIDELGHVNNIVYFK